MIYASSNGVVTLIVEPDTDALSPREDCEPFGHLVCWHRRYRLGDEHAFETPWDCLRDLCSRYVQDGDALDDMGIDELKAVLAQRTDLAILPVYLYDHSGLAMSTGSFLGRAPHADWDSGQVGYIYADREDIVTTYGDASQISVERARALLDAEVKDYDAWLRGDVWGYRLFVDGCERDACWGFVGDIDDIKADIAGCMPDEARGMIDSLELRWVDAESYLHGLTARSAS